MAEEGLRALSNFSNQTQSCQLWIAVLTALLLSTASVDAQSQSITEAPPEAEALAPLFEVSELAVENLDIFEDPISTELIVEIPVNAETWTLRLAPYSMRSDKFRVFTDDGSGDLQVYPTPPVTTRRGEVLEIPGSSVAASFYQGQLKATIHTATETWIIQPVTDVGISSLESWHVVYPAVNSLRGPETCGVPDGVVSGGGAAGGISSFGTTLFLTEIGIDSDFEYYVANGQNVNNTVNDIESVMNSVENTYEVAAIQIGYEITTIIIRTSSSDPYGTQSNPGALLSSFNSVWSSAPENGVDRDVAHLFTGVNLDSTVIGIANLSDICTSNAYGLSQSRFTSNFNRRVALTSHELGHNWSSTHCNSQAECRIMCSGLGGCNGVNPLSFAPVPIGQIVGYRNSRSCLSDRPPPTTLPFIEEFTSGALDANRWIYNSGGAVTSQAIGEPSAPSSFVLDAAGSGLYDKDELRSNFIDLNGTSNVNLSFFVEHRGVESGEEFVIEFLNSGLDWVELDRITSNGVDQSTFTQFTYNLSQTPGAIHNQFRIRFRTEVNASNDDWYIDNITINEGPPPSIDPPTLLTMNPLSGPTAGGTQVTISGFDFAPDILVLVGSQLLVDQIFIDDMTVVGKTPFNPIPGPVTVSVNQASGVDSIPALFRYTQEDIIHGSGTSAPGTLVTVPIIADHETTLAGFSLGMDFDASEITVDSITGAGTESANADFFQESINNSTGPGGGWWTLGVVLSFTGSSIIVPGPDSVLVEATYSIPPTANLGDQIQITPVSGIGSPPTDNLLVAIGGSTLIPSLIPGIISTEGVVFLRGDTNADGQVNIGDAVSILGFLFSQEPNDCLDAIDTNDDGMADIGDAIYLLDFLFSQGPPPAIPFPNPGVDPTADLLDCNP